MGGMLWLGYVEEDFGEGYCTKMMIYIKHCMYTMKYAIWCFITTIRGH